MFKSPSRYEEMTGIATLIATSCMLAAAASCASAEIPAAPTWCKTATVTGTLRSGTAQHPNGSKVAYYYLALKQPLTIAAGKCEGATVNPATVKEVQVKEYPQVMSRFVGKVVSVAGEIALPENAYDVLPVILYPPITVKAE
jgi:hypothetical protein